MTKYDEQSIQQRITALLNEANELAGIDLPPARVTQYAAELAVTFHRLSREMARFGAAQWSRQHLDSPANAKEPPDAIGPSEELTSAPAVPGDQSFATPTVDQSGTSSADNPQTKAPAAPGLTTAHESAPAGQTDRAIILETPTKPSHTSPAEQLRRQWFSRNRTVKPASRAHKAAVDRSLMKSVAHSIGECPKHLRGLTPLVRELESLETFHTADTHLLHGLPKSDLHLLLTALAFRLRAVQSADDWTRLLPEHHRRADRLHHRIAGMAKDTRCGLVHGLAHAHNPQQESWLVDAQVATAELRVRTGLRQKSDGDLRLPSPQQVLNELGGDAAARMLPEEFIKQVKWLFEHGIRPNDGKLVRAASHFIPDLTDVSGMSDLRRNASRFLDEQEDSEPEYTLERDLPLLKITRGMRAVIVGGDPRNGREEAIQREFEFASCEWIHFAEGIGKQRLAALCERIRSGGVDMVIVLSAYCSHTISDRMFELKNDTAVVLSRTYGIRQIEAAIERFLGSSERAED